MWHGVALRGRAEELTEHRWLLRENRMHGIGTRLGWMARGVRKLVLEVARSERSGKLRYARRRLRHFGMPMWKKMSVELHSLCNRDCQFCPRYNDRSGVRKDTDGVPVKVQMETQRVLSIIDQSVALGFRGAIGFHRLSEGTLDSRFLEFYRYALDKGLQFKDATNGDVLEKNPDLCAALDSEQTTLTIGLYDVTASEELERKKSVWRDRFKNAEICFSVPTEEMQIRQNSKVYDIAQKDHAILDLPCFLQKDLLIRYDGNVSLCYQDDNCTFDLGNAFEEPLEKIWWSAKRVAIVKGVRKREGRHALPLCSTCYVAKKRALHEHGLEHGSEHGFATARRSR